MNFTNEEYKSRLKKVQASMQKKGIELLIAFIADVIGVVTLVFGFAKFTLSKID